MNKFKLKSIDQNGVVSILSVVIFATIITIIVASYFSTIVSQQRDAINYDRGTRAFYAAESGAQDAVRGLNADANLMNSGQDLCNPRTNGGVVGETAGDLADNGGASYTCQIINPNPIALEGDVTPTSNSMLLINPKPAVPGDYKLVLSWWSDRVTTDVSTRRVGKNPQDNLFYPTNKWKNSAGTALYPAMRTNVISLPKVGYTRADIKQSILFLNPISSDVTTNDAKTIDYDLASKQDPAQIGTQAVCYSNQLNAPYDNKYYCQQTITLQDYNFITQTIYLRLHSLYEATHFQVKLLSPSGTPVTLSSSQATVDVTGRSGNTYKRVRQVFPVNNGSSKDTWPDAALVAGDGICKLFRVGSAPSQFQSDCNPLATTP